MESQSKTKRKLAAQLPGHLLERISWKDWPIIAKESANDDLVVSLMFPIWLFVGDYPKMTISCLKREKTPKYTEEQAEKAKNLCKKLDNLLYRSKCCVVLDDEKYFTFDGSNMEGNNNFYTNDKSNCPDSVRFVGKEKFPPKVMVWADICKCGVSKQIIRRSKPGAVNSDIYIKECLEKRMLPFIHEHLQDKITFSGLI